MPDRDSHYLPWPWLSSSKALRKVKVEVYSLVFSAKRYSPDFTQLPPGHRTCSFISYLNSPGSIQPGCHFRRTELFKHTSFTVLPGTHLLLGRESARVGKVPCLGAQRRSIIQPSRGSNRRPLACKSRTLPLSHDDAHNITVLQPDVYSSTAAQKEYISDYSSHCTAQRE